MRLTGTPPKVAGRARNANTSACKLIEFMSSAGTGQRGGLFSKTLCPMALAVSSSRR